MPTQVWTHCRSGLRARLTVLGATLVFAVACEGVYRLQGALRRLVASAARPRVAHPYAQEPWFPAFDAEEHASRLMQWEPYVYWRRRPYRGRYINVDSSGRRRTVQPLGRRAPARRIWFFGGSAMWGTGARDEGTIPSQVGALLSEHGVDDVAITNYGETGYVFTQELLRLELELRRGARPDVVVFYDGINDIAAAVMDGQAGVPQNESNRAAEFQLGRRLGPDNDLRAFVTALGLAASRSALLRRLTTLESPAPAESPSSDTLARRVVDTYAATAQLAEALARRYGAQVCYFWQPALYTTRKALTPYEQALRAKLDGDPFERRLRTVPVAATAAIDARMAGVAPGRFTNLSGLFDGDTTTVFLDQIGHTTERADRRLAAVMLDRLLAVLPPTRTGRAIAVRR